MQAVSAASVESPRTETSMDIVFVSAEVAPWSKTGGLGDVVGSLPVALARRGHRVMVVAPRQAVPCATVHADECSCGRTAFAHPSADRVNRAMAETSVTAVKLLGNEGCFAPGVA